MSALMKRRQALAAMLLVAGAGLAVAGGATEGTAGDQRYDVSMTIAEFAQFPYSEDWAIIAAIREKTNINLQPEIIPTSDYGTKIDIMLAAGSGPDLITNIYNNRYVKPADLGILFPWGDHYADMPNLSALLASDAVWRNSVETQWRRADGKVYMLPSLRDNVDAEFGMMIRDDLFEQHYGKLPATADELLDALVAIKRGEGPDFLGWGARNLTGAFLKTVGAMFHPAPAGWNYGTGFTYDAAADRWVFGVDQPYTKEFLAYARRLVEAGLVDPENYTQDVKTFESKLTNGRYAIAGTWYPGIGRLTPIGQEQVGGQFSLKMLPVPAATPDAGLVVEKFRATTVAFASVMRDKSQAEREAIIAFADWMYGDDASMAQSWGILGESYVVEGGVRKPAANVRTGRNPQGTVEPRSSFGVNVLSLTWHLMGDAEAAFVWNDEIEDYILTMDRQGKWLNPDPQIFLNSSEQEDVDLYSSDLRAYVEESFLKFINGELSLERDWDAFIAGAKDKRSNQIGDIYNAAWARQN